MPDQTPLLNPRRLQLMIALVTLLAAVYMAIYSGRIESGDSFYLFDAVGSVVEFNDLLLDLSAGTRPPQTFDTITSYPLPTVDAEPLQILLAAPLYALARAVPGVGLAHVVWLFNVVVAALAGGVLFLYALALGYRERTAVLAALLFGLCTVIVPYSKTFFREPLTLLMILLAGLFAQRWRASNYRSVPLLAMIVCVLGMILAKATAALALPALFVIVMPTLRRANRRAFLALGAALVLVALVFVLLALFGDELGIGRRYNPLARLINGTSEFFPIALHSYLFSIGGSIWATSPITLLAIPGLVLLYRARQPRYIAVVLLMLGAFAFGYAFSSGAFWFGGLSWPPRFLVPVVPFLMLGALPVVDRLAQARPPRVLVLAVVVLVVYSVWVQASAVTLAWGAYTEGLPPEANGLLEWGGGLNLVRYLRWVVIPSLWATRPLNFAWARVDAPLWLISFGGLALACAVVLAGLMRRDVPRRAAWVTAALPLVLAGFVVVALRSLYIDPYYFPDRAGLFPMLSIIEAETGDGDIVLLSNREYERFFLNYAKLDDVRIVTLPPQPGDRPSEEQPADVTSSNPDVLLTNYSLPFIHSMTETRDRIWLLENRGADFAWAVRPVERFMAAHYYPVRVIQSEPPDPTVRLIEYSTTDAPDPSSYLNPEITSELVYGDALRLAGYTLPNGTTYQAGNLLPVSFSWRADAVLAQDVRIAWFLRAADGAPVAQGMDSRPGGDFELTSQWRVGVPHWDNRALRIPLDTPPGMYRMWVKVYYLDATFTPRDLAASGSEVLDGVIGVLPTVITVE